MKNIIIVSFQRIMDDRYMSIILSLFIVSCILSFIYVILSVHSSELQVVVHYSSFGTTNFYRDRWYYLLTFAGFIFVHAVTYTFMAYRLLNSRGREFAIPFIYLGFVVLVVALTLFYQIVKVASLS